GTARKLAQFARHVRHAGATRVDVAAVRARGPWFVHPVALGALDGLLPRLFRLILLLWPTVIQLCRAVLKEVVHLIPEAQHVAAVVQERADLLAGVRAQ